MSNLMEFSLIISLPFSFASENLFSDARDKNFCSLMSYDDWQESVTDYALWYSTFAYKCKTENQLYTLLNKQYAEATYYPQALKRTFCLIKIKKTWEFGN